MNCVWKTYKLPPVALGYGLLLLGNNSLDEVTQDLAPSVVIWCLVCVCACVRARVRAYVCEISQKLITHTTSATSQSLPHTSNFNQTMKRDAIV